LISIKSNYEDGKVVAQLNEDIRQLIKAYQFFFREDDKHILPPVALRICERKTEISRLKNLHLEQTMYLMDFD
jgi:hypothetical protein